ncbi:MAG: hypothetical protein J2P13_01800 [Acidobacteria bacterium]|nr:hypothetical protein [Acidobacteriota bacterium]
MAWLSVPGIASGLVEAALSSAGSDELVRRRKQPLGRARPQHERQRSVHCLDQALRLARRPGGDAPDGSGADNERAGVEDEELEIELTRVYKFGDARPHLMEGINVPGVAGRSKADL